MAKESKTTGTSARVQSKDQAKKDPAPVKAAVKGSSKSAPKSSTKSDPKSDSKSVAKNAPKKAPKNVQKSTAKSASKSQKKTNKKPNIFKRFAAYIRNVRLEIKRTTWPSRKEVLNMTIIVVVALLFFGVLILVLDQVMVQIVNFLSQFKVGANAPADNAVNVVNVADAMAQYARFLLTGGK
ncbi:MAG: preprotein translocase subunit SecE [Coriobacteriia bacterium]|nr:preprotein translocase subunit SecE [Coriobacteriia bacterium]